MPGAVRQAELDTQSFWTFTLYARACGHVADLWTLLWLSCLLACSYLAYFRQSGKFTVAFMKQGGEKVCALPCVHLVLSVAYCSSNRGHVIYILAHRHALQCLLVSVRAVNTWSHALSILVVDQRYIIRPPWHMIA